MITSLLNFLGYQYSKKGRLSLRIIQVIYTMLVASLLASPVLVGIYNATETNDPVVISLVIFTLIPFVQYCFGFRYFQQSHFTEIMTDCRKDGVTMPKKHMVWIIAFSIVVLMLVSKLFLYILVDPPAVYKSWLTTNDNLQLNGTAIGLILYLAIYSIYAWTAVSLNLTVFFLVFYKHILDLKNLHDYIDTELIWKLDQANINDLTRKIVAIKYVISGSIDKLESFYTTATIIGAVGLGPIIEFSLIDSHLILYIVVYALMQLLFLSVIYSVSYYRGEIHKLVKSPMIMSRYLNQVKSLGNIEAIQASNTGDTHALNNFRLTAFCPVTYGDIDLESGGSSGTKLDAQILTLEYKALFGLDWIILHHYLSESWANFSLMGISFGDTSVIKKGIGLTSVIIVASTYINSLMISR